MHGMDTQHHYYKESAATTTHFTLHYVENIDWSTSSPNSLSHGVRLPDQSLLRSHMYCRTTTYKTIILLSLGIKKNLLSPTGGDSSNKGCFGRKTNLFRESGDFAGNRETWEIFREIWDIFGTLSKDLILHVIKQYICTVICTLRMRWSLCILTLENSLTPHDTKRPISNVSNENSSWSAIDHVQSPADWHKNRAGARHILSVYLTESNIYPGQFQKPHKI